VVISIHQWTAKEASGHQRSSSHHMITWWQSAFISGHQHSSAVIISPYDHMVAISIHQWPSAFISGHHLTT
jgi:hypothetical protein